MTDEVDYDRDPELLDDDNEGTGDVRLYDESLTEFGYDPDLFELPEDFEYLDEDDENG